jgi:hypothetical protein
VRPRGPGNEDAADAFERVDFPKVLSRFFRGSYVRLREVFLEFCIQNCLKGTIRI